VRGIRFGLCLVLGFWLLSVPAAVVFAGDADDALGDKGESHSFSQATRADQDGDDLSRGMEESINVDESWIENSLFLFAFAENDLSKGHSFNLEGEWSLPFDHDFGMELEFPQVLAFQPLGHGPAALGPIGLNLRYVYYQFGTDESSTAGVFSLQAGGAYWATADDRFPGVGSSLTAEALGGFRFGRVFLQGVYG
jgi:hypothetical protein